MKLLTIFVSIVSVNKNGKLYCWRFVVVLCSDRVSQMSKTYDDIEAVTRLLEEVYS